MRKLIIVSEFVRESDNSTGFIWSRIIKNFGENGTCVVVCPEISTNSVDPSDGVVWKRFVRHQYNKNNLFSRIFGQLRLTFQFVNIIIRCSKPGDILFIGTNPTLLLIICPLIKYIRKLKWVVLVHDVYPENLVPAKILKKNSIIYHALKILFSRVYGAADRLIVIGRDMEKLIRSKVKRPDVVHFIPNWAPQNTVASFSRLASPLLKDLDWDDKIVFQFFGNIGRLQGIEELLQAISLITSEKAAFVFWGDGANRFLVEDFIVKFPLKNVAYLGSAPMERKWDVLATCDVALVTLQKGMVGLGVPSKAYFSMAANKPLLAVMEPDAEVARMVSEHKVGWQCDPGEAVALASLIDEICSLRNPHTFFGNKPRIVLEKYYSEDLAIYHFFELMQNLKNEK